MMRLPKFDYRTPQTIAEAVRMMGETGPEGQFVAGGTDLYPNMKRRQQMPQTVISVMRLAELNQITGDGKSGLRIGASVILTDICEHPIINRDYPVVAHAARPFCATWERSAATCCSTRVVTTTTKTTSGAKASTSVSRKTATFAGSRPGARSVGRCSHRISCR